MRLLKSFLLTAVGLLYGISCVAQTFTVDNITYEVTSPQKKTVKVKKGSRTISGKLVIPSQVINDKISYDVNVIDYKAFEWCTGITELVISEGVDSILRQSFYGCDALKKVEIPGSVVYIDNAVFSSDSLDYLYFKDGSLPLRTGVISSFINKLYIGRSLNNDKRPLTFFTNVGSVEFGENINKIQKSLFAQCTIKNIVIPKHIKIIESEAFSSCRGFQSIIIPANVDSIKGSAFSFCKDLREIVIEDGNSELIVDGGWLLGYPIDSIYIGRNMNCFKVYEPIKKLEIGGLASSINESMFLRCNGIESIIISGKIDSIGSNAFDGCIGLKQLSLSNSIYYIGNSAFNGCSGLTQVKLPNSINYIGNEAFSGCTGLTQILLPKSVNYIGKRAFRGCENLESFEIPSSLKKIEDYTFSNCNTIKLIKIPENIDSIGRYAFENCNNIKNIIIDDDGSVLNVGNNWISSNSEIEKIYIGRNIDGNWLGYGLPVKFVEFGNNITYINKYFFNGNGYLERVILPETVDSIYPGAFKECKNLKQINIPDNVVYIGEYAFEVCSNLTSISLPDGITSISDYSFAGCSSLTSIEFPESIVSIGDEAFADCKGFTTLNFPKSLKSIGKDAFGDCTGLTSLQFSDGLESIGYNAFRRCTGLTSLQFPNKLKSIGSDAFSDCTGLVSIDLSGGLENIDNGAFRGCTGITELEIPENVTTIGSYAFEGCNNIKKLIIHDSEKELSAKDLFGSYNDVYPLEELYLGRNLSGLSFGKHKLTKVTIGEKVTDIHSGMFEECSSLRSIHLPESLKRIGSHAFKKSGLERIVIPSSVLDVEMYAFEECMNLNYIGIKDSSSPLKCGDLAFAITQYGFDNSLDSIYLGRDLYFVHDYYKPFGQLNNLSYLEFGDSISFIGEEFFSNSGKLEYVEIPENVKRIGRIAFAGCPVLTTVKMTDGYLDIDETAFYLCENLKNVRFSESTNNIGLGAFYGCSKIESLENLEYVKRIDDYAFWGCNKLDSIELSDSLTYLGNSSFKHCHNLKYVKFNDSETGVILGDSVFAETQVEKMYIGKDLSHVEGLVEMKKLKSVEIGPKVSELDFDMFSECPVISEVKICDSEDYLDVLGSVSKECSIEHLYIGRTVDYMPLNGSKALKELVIGPWAYDLQYVNFNNCPNLSLLYIKGSTWDLKLKEGMFENTPLDTIYIGRNIDSEYSPFRFNEKIKYVETGGGMDRLSNSLFNGCSNLETLKLSDRLISIGGSALANCSALKFVTMPSTLESIGDSVFYNCQLLSSVEFNESLRNIGSSAFEKCKGLVALDLPSNLETIGNRAFKECEGLSSMVLPDNLTEIGEGLFEYCGSLTQVKFPYYLSNIPDYTFYGCFNLETVEIPPYVESLGNSAFQSCGKLTSMDFTGNLRTIGDNCFMFCMGLSEINIPSNILSVGGNAFATSTLKKVNIEDGEEVLALGENAFDSSLDSLYFGRNLTFYGNSVFANMRSMKSLIIGKNVTTIPEGTFTFCSGIKELNIPDNVTVIGDNAFSSCSGLLSLSLGNNVNEIGAYAFNNCAGLNSVTFPESLVTIGSSAFEGCYGFTTLEIPGNVNTIGDSSFAYCSSLKYISLNDGKEDLAIGDYAFGRCLPDSIFVDRNLSYKNSPFRGLSSLESLKIGNNVTNIAHDCFVDCEGLVSVTVPDNVISVSDNAFKGCSSVASLALGNSVSRIGSGAFSGLALLMELDLPQSLESIGNGAFAGCSELQEIKVPESVSNIGESAFSGCLKLQTLELGSGVESIGSNAFEKCDRLKTVSSYAVNPPVMPVDGFSDYTYFASTLYVPAGSLDAYKDDGSWFKFINIKAMGEQEKDTYTVTFETQVEGGTFTVLAGGKEIVSGDKVEEGTSLTILPVADENYAVDSVLVNNILLEERDGNYETVVDSDLEITVKFRLIETSLGENIYDNVYYDAKEQVIYSYGSDVRIYNVSGINVINARDKQTVDVSSLENGIYIVVINGSIIFKFEK